MIAIVAPVGAQWEGRLEDVGAMAPMGDMLQATVAGRDVYYVEVAFDQAGAARAAIALSALDVRFAVVAGGAPVTAALLDAAICVTEAGGRFEDAAYAVATLDLSECARHRRPPYRSDGSLARSADGGRERALVMLRPESLVLRAVGEALVAIECLEGIELLAAKMVRPRPADIHAIYDRPDNRHWLAGIVQAHCGGRSLAVVAEGPAGCLYDALTGVKRRLRANRASPDVPSRYNFMHASDSVAAASREIALFFESRELASNGPWAMNAGLPFLGDASPRLTLA